MALIYCEIDEIELTNDNGISVESVQATCKRCGHTTESYGIYNESISRCLAIMREECPNSETNYYKADE